MIMSAYYFVFQNSIKARLQYRLELALNLMFGIIPTIAIVSMWFSLFLGREQIAGYNLGQIVTYTIIAKLLEQTLLPAMHWDISGEIQDGEVAKYFVKPISHFYYWFWKSGGEKLVSLLVSLVPLTVVVVLLSDYIVFPGVLNVIFFLVALVFAFSLYFLIYYALSIVAFWLVDVTAFFFTLDIVIELLSGVLLPLDLFPQGVQQILSALPFQYMIYFPVKIFLTQLGTEQILQGFIIQVAWIGILGVLINFMWNRGVRHYDAAGA